MATNHLTLETSAGVISYALNRSSRRRTMEIAIVDAQHARVTVPSFVTQATIEQFIHSRSTWIITKIHEKRKIQEHINRKKYETGQGFFFLGRSYPLLIQTHGRQNSQITFDANGWTLTMNLDQGEREIKKQLVQWYRREAGEIFGSRVFHYSRVMGLAPQKITVKTQKRLWGSCNPHGQSINLNWVLVMAPLDVIDAVVVHELCHLEIPNHSHRFWKKVFRYLPDYKERSLWLKTHAHDMLLP